MMASSDQFGKTEMTGSPPFPYIENHTSHHQTPVEPESMNSPDPFVPPFRLGPWLVRSDLNRLEGPDGQVQIEPRVMKVLLCLAENPGTVLTRNQLLDLVWSDTVVGEEILTRAVSELRRVFGDSARNPAYIETIRNHGYRLIAEVQPVVSGPDAPEIPPAPAPTPDPEQPPTMPRRFPVLTWLVPLLLLALMVMIWWRPWSPGPEERISDPGKPPQALPLTSYPGREWHPALSPDGTRVSFIRRLPGSDHSDLFIKQRNNEAALQLTAGPGWAAWPAWSPDGQTLAFVRSGPEGPALCTIPSLGGAVRTLRELSSLVDGLDWSPDGSTLVYAARDEASGEYRLHSLTLADLTVQVLPPYREAQAGDFMPRFSPDGRRLAWMSMDQDGACVVVVGSASGESSEFVTEPLTGVQGLAWTSDGRSVVYAASPGGYFRLWQTEVETGRVSLIPTGGDFAWHPTVARQSGELAFEQVRMDQDLWRIKVLAEQPRQVATAPFLQSTRWEFEAAVSPEGAQVAVISARSGSPEIWLTDEAGESLQRLTSHRADALSGLRWNPQGTMLAYNLVEGGRQRIWVAAVNGAEPRPFTSRGSQEILADWEPDGQGLAFARNGDQGWQVYRRGLEGTGELDLTTRGGITARFGAQGHLLYHVRPDREGIWQISLDDPAALPHLLIPDLGSTDRDNWLVRGQALFWVLRSGPSAILGRRDLVTGESAFLTDLPEFSGSGLEIAPDGRAIYYPRTGEMAGDLMILPNFQKNKKFLTN
jgi:Tol biopolymer transport system component/DNA-binding winged helix-turn-helix (wHTH) protein